MTIKEEREKLYEVGLQLSCFDRVNSNYYTKKKELLHARTAIIIIYVECFIKFFTWDIEVFQRYLESNGYDFSISEIERRLKEGGY